MRKSFVFEKGIKLFEKSFSFGKACYRDLFIQAIKGKKRIKNITISWEVNKEKKRIKNKRENVENEWVV